LAAVTLRGYGCDSIAGQNQGCLEKRGLLISGSISALLSVVD
jgi:hypothetical protein